MSQFGVPPTMVHQWEMIHHWKSALLEGALEVLERGGTARGPEVDEETIEALYRGIGELAAADDLFP